MTIYQPTDFMATARAALKDQRKHCPDVKVTLNDPPWFVCLDGQNSCLAVRLRYEGNGVITETQYNVAI